MTGAGSGLGRELALAYAREGAEVLLCDVNQARAEETLALMPGSGHAVHVFDVSDPGAWQAMKQTIESRGRGIDVLFNNAGIASGGKIADIPDQEWARVMKINLDGVFFASRAIAPLMVQQRRGHILATASLAGFVGSPELGAYGVSKAAVIALSEILRQEMSVHGVRVSVVCPSFFKTNLLESLEISHDRVGKFAARQMARGELNATDVASYVLRQAERGQFLILPHAEARRVHWLKRLFPNWLARRVRQHFEMAEKAA